MKTKQTLLVVSAIVASLWGAMTVVPIANATPSCNGTPTAIVDCGGTADDNKSGKVSDNAIWKLLVMTLRIMAAGVGILAVAGISYAAVLYVTAADSAEQIKKSKTMITNVVIGIIAFALMYAFLNFLIPGGVFA